MAAVTDDERTIDGKGQVAIPDEVREALKLESRANVRIGVEGDRIAIRPRVSREEFIEVMEGCITEGRSVLPSRGVD